MESQCFDCGVEVRELEHTICIDCNKIVCWKCAVPYENNDLDEYKCNDCQHQQGGKDE